MKKFLSKKMMLLPPFEPFSVLFTESGTFEVPRGCKKLTVVLVGGGASAGRNSYHKPDIFNTYHITGGAGGSGAKVILEFTHQNMPSSFDFTVGQATTGLLQNGGDTSVTAGETTYTAGGGVKPYQCGGGDGDTANFGGSGGTPNVEVGGGVIFAQGGTTGQAGGYRGGSTARTTGWEIDGTVYGSGGGQYGNSNAYGEYQQGDAGCIFVIAE